MKLKSYGKSNSKCLTAPNSYENSSYTDNPPLDIRIFGYPNGLTVQIICESVHCALCCHMDGNWCHCTEERRVRGGASQLISCGWSANVNLAPDLTTYSTYYQDFSENLWSVANLI